MAEIKTEYNSICHGCLSNDRKISPLGENSDIFLNIIGNDQQSLIYSTEDIKLCWECKAKLKQFKMFQKQLRKAQEILVKFLYGLEIPTMILSKLTTSTKSVYDHEIEYRRRKRFKNIEDNKNTLTESVDKDVKEPNAESKCKDKIIYQDDLLKSIHNHNQSQANETKNSIVDSLRKDLLESIEDNHKESEVKTEIVPDMNDEIKPVLYAVELPSHNYSKSDDLRNLADNLITNIDDEIEDSIDHDTEFLYDVKAERIDSETRDKKFKRSTIYDREHHYKKLYREHAKLIETKQRNWGDTQSYFTKVYFSENELEQLIFVKERHYADLGRYPFSCSMCKLGYKLRLDLKRHNNLNHRKPGAPCKCSHCHKVLPSQQDLESHWREHSPIAKCKMCCNVLRPRGMKQHLNTAHTRRYSCCYCTMTFETLTTFGTHFRDMHMKFTCDYCNKNFKSKSRIAYHIRHTHVPAYCADCNRTYLNLGQLQKHCILMHPERANRTENREACFCVECDKQYSSVAQYRKHLKVSIKHVEVKKQTTPCPECGKHFARKLYMKNHYNLYHLKKTKFYCELCDKYFARAFGLRVHNTHVHQKVQRVRDKICDLCGRAFTNNRTMLNHRRTHTGERPHKCPYCSAEFIQKYAMQTHMRTQHKHFT